MSLNNSDYSLSTLLESTPYKLAYSLPLLFVSLILTFAGAFLILDRTHAFAPRHPPHLAPSPDGMSRGKPVQRSLQRVLLLEGGIGGLLSGYAFGVFLATFLSLIIPGVAKSRPLSSRLFLAIWILAAICCTFVAGRWRYAALFFAGTTGYCTLGLAICVIVHPSLLTRIILTSALALIGTVFCLLPLQRYQHVFVRIATSASGAFGVVTSVALLSSISAWSNVWQRLWVSDGDGWGTDAEKGLSAAYCLMLLSGTACDWFLRRKLGENPDEKWDSYLAEYAANLPKTSDRAGTFTPLLSFWSRHFGHDNARIVSEDFVYPIDADLKRPIPPPIRLYRRQSSVSPTHISDERARYLQKSQKKSSHGFKRTRNAVKFMPLEEGVLSSSEEDSESSNTHVPSWSLEEKQTSLALARSTSRTDSSTTLMDQLPASSSENGLPRQSYIDKFRTSPISSTAEPVEHEDVTSGKIDQYVVATSSHWTPSFLQRFPGSEAQHRQSGPSSNEPSDQTAGAQSGVTVPSSPIPFAPVPATPSLIRAIDRLSAAQQIAHDPHVPSKSPTAELEMGRTQHPLWHTFWHDVKVTANKVAPTKN